MDLSALIFVALAAAWAVYLVPKALKAHEVDSLTRGVDRFSDRMRVLARREPVSADRAALVVGGAGAAVPAAEADTDIDAETDTHGPAADRVEPEEAQQLTRLQLRLRRAAAQRAAQRRRRVLGFILFVNAVVFGVAIAGLLEWPYVAAPVATLVTWLVMCRLMVRRERATRTPQVVRKKRTTLADQAIAEEEAAVVDDDGPCTEEIEAVTDEPAQEDGWDPVPLTLPTYVAKAPAGRTVRTIDLDATGVWSSGRNAADSQLAREAEQAEQAAPEERRATGS